jgi:mycoredoxin
MSANLNKMKLYHTEWCPECEAVREKLAELGVSYEDEIVPDVRPFRKKVYEVSGQYYVPVLVHGETVLTETSDILAYLDNHDDPGHPSVADWQEPFKPPSSSLDERNH